MKSAVAFAALLFIASTAFSAEEAFDPIAGNEGLERLEAQLSEMELSEEALDAAWEAVTKRRSDATRCVDATRPQVNQLNEELEILGEPAEDDTPEILGQRDATMKRLTPQRARLSNCELVVSRSTALLKEIDALRAEATSMRLWSRNPGLLRIKPPLAISDWTSSAGQLVKLSPRASDELSAIKRNLLVLLALGIAAGIAIRFFFSRWYRRSGAAEGPPRLKFLFPKPLADNAFLILPALAAISVIAATHAPALNELLPYRLAIAVLVFAIGRVFIAWSSGPLSPAARVDGLVPEYAARYRNWLTAFVATLAGGYLVFGPGLLVEAPAESDLWPRGLFALALTVSLIGFSRLLGHVSGLQKRFKLARFVLALALIAGLLAETLGYHNLTNYLFKGVIGSVLVIFGLWMTIWLVDVAVEWVSKGTTRTAYRARTLFGLNPKAAQSELGWIQLGLDVALWLAFGVLIVLAWDSTGNWLSRITTFVSEGVRISDEGRIVPAAILRGIIALTAILVVTGWVKRWIQRRWVRNKRMDRGARDALVTVVGYIGFIVAVLLGLTLAGVKFAGLAIVAGALSVGIGFGLQNIVNNFVSGLILLFERPIKAGDFVTVSNVEGTVKRISIRSTEIETLDRQNVIVPNSELVSGQVTNWVLHDPYGRLILSVGVAYGSDTELVRDTLREIAEANEEVLSDSKRTPAPKILFVGFGDNSLDFQLRVWIKHIERRFDVTSQLNFAIDQAFREKGIEIAFPQRDIHIRSGLENLAPDKK